MSNKTNIHQSTNNIRRLIVARWCNTYLNTLPLSIRGSLWEYSKLTSNEFQTEENDLRNPASEETFSFISWGSNGQWMGRISLIARVEFGGSCVQFQHGDQPRGAIESIKIKNDRTRTTDENDDELVTDVILISCENRTTTPIHLLKQDLDTFFPHLLEFCLRYRVRVVMGTPRRTNSRTALESLLPWNEDLCPSEADCLSPMSWDFGDRSAFFYHDFKRKINLDDTFAQTEDGRLQSEDVLKILTKLRGIQSPQEIPSDDPAIGELLLLDEKKLKDYLKHIGPYQMDVLLGYSDVEFEFELCGEWKEVIVTGLPTELMENDDLLVELNGLDGMDVWEKMEALDGTSLKLSLLDSIGETGLSRLTHCVRDFLLGNGFSIDAADNVTVVPLLS